MSNFLQQRTARINVNEYLGPAFNLENGAPQGLVLGLTLYSLYTNDTTETKPNNLTIMFTDDVTQIITTDKGRKTGLWILTLRTQREVGKQNQYEKEQKIKTNMKKFLVVPVSRRKTQEFE